MEAKLGYEKVEDGVPPSSESVRQAEPIVLVFATDENYAMPLGVTLYSALVNLRTHDPVHVFILDGGLSPTSIRRLRRVTRNGCARATVDFVKPDLDFIRAYPVRMEARFTEANLFRIVIPDLLPANYTRAIYLDCDMVVEKDLSTFFSQDMEGNAVLAVRDYSIPYVSSEPKGIFNWKELGLNAQAPYFNSGFMVMDLTRWREENIGLRVLQYLSENRDRLNKQGNQEGFNAILAGQWRLLDLRWNLIDWFYNEETFQRSEFFPHVKAHRTDFIRDPYIIHYTARLKPWHHTCPHVARSRFFYYLHRSGWFSTPEYGWWRINVGFKQAGTDFWHFVRVRSKPYRKAIKRRLNGAALTA